LTEDSLDDEELLTEDCEDSELGSSEWPPDDCELLSDSSDDAELLAEECEESELGTSEGPSDG